MPKYPKNDADRNPFTDAIRRVDKAIKRDAIRPR